MDEQRMPSGIACLENYHTKENVGVGLISDDPVHDAASHGCDALRTFAEAESQHLLEGASQVARHARLKPIVVHRGAGPDSYGGGPRKPIVVRR